MASFDDSSRPQFLLFWMYGIWTMAFFHNLCVSILLYKNRNKNVSNFIKIVFNLAGLGKALGAVASSTVPDNITDVACQGLGYYGNLDSALFRISLAAFLLWRIKQIEFKRFDMYIGFPLFAMSLFLQIARSFFYTLHSTYFPITNTSSCSGTPTSHGNIVYWITIGLDLALDIFVTFRLVQILGRANKNAKFITPNMQNSYKRTLFTSVMYWNFLRLGVSFMYLMLMGFNVLFVDYINQADIMPAGFTFVYVALSYLVTADAEIVRVIEGRTSISEKSTSESTGTDKPFFKGFGIRHGPRSSKNTDYIISAPSFSMTTSQQTERVDANTVVGSSTELSINDVEQGAMEEVEEEIQNNTDTESGIVVTRQEMQRESDHSLATITSE